MSYEYVLFSDTERVHPPRFAPGRDLRKNFWLDIAKELENHLGETESIPITFEGGATNVDFAEGGMIFQGETLG